MKKTLWVLAVTLCTVLVLAACASGTTPAPKSTPPSPTSDESKPAVPPSPATTNPPGAASKPPAITSAPVSFAGKTITIVSPSSPGGGADASARLYSTFLPKYLPGNPSIIVRNMPGGAATIGTNYVYGAKPDGLTLLGGSGSVMVSYAMGVASVKYDLKKMPPVVASRSTQIIFSSPGVVVGGIQNIAKADNIIFGQNPGTSTYIFLTAIKLLDVKPKKMVLGYSSGGDSIRALISGEINTTGTSNEGYPTTAGPLIKSGEAVNLFQTGFVQSKGKFIRDPVLPNDVPMLSEVYEMIYGKSPSGIAWDGFQTIMSIGKTYVNPLLLPPGTPDNVLRTYWDATAKMVADPQFKDYAVRLGSTGFFYYGQDLADNFRQETDMDPEVIKWFKGVLADYGVAE